MCASIGIASQAPGSNRDWLAFGRDAMSHQGPGSAGAWWSTDVCVGLGLRLLPPIDRAPGGHQPMGGGEGLSYNFQELQRGIQAKGHFFQSKKDTVVDLPTCRGGVAIASSLINGIAAKIMIKL